MGQDQCCGFRKQIQRVSRKIGEDDGAAQVELRDIHVQTQASDHGSMPFSGDKPYDFVVISSDDDILHGKSGPS